LHKKHSSKIALLVDPINYVHILSITIGQDTWRNLEKAFQDSGLNRRVLVEVGLRNLISTKLEDSQSVEDYVNCIIGTMHKFKGISIINDEWISVLMLAEFPESYKPMMLGLENSVCRLPRIQLKLNCCRM